MNVSEQIRPYGVKQAATRIALALGELRDAPGADGLGSERQRQLIVLDSLASRLPVLMMQSASDRQTVQNVFQSELAGLGMRDPMSGAVWPSSATPVDLREGGGFYDMSDCPDDGGPCHPRLFLKFAGVNIVDGHYEYDDAGWSFRDRYAEAPFTTGPAVADPWVAVPTAWAIRLVDNGHFYADLNPVTGQWIDNTTAGAVRLSADGLSGILTSHSGLDTTRLSARASALAQYEDGANSTVSLPADARTYQIRVVQQNEVYRLIIDDPVSTYLATGTTVPFTSFEAFMQAYRTKPDNVLSSPRYADYSFDAEGATEAGGQMTFYYSPSEGAQRAYAKGRYAWRMVGGQKLLEITEVPVQFMLNGYLDKGRFFALRNGQLYSGQHLKPGQRPVLGITQGLNRTAVDAILARRMLPPLP